MRQQNIVKEKSFAFSIQIISLYKRLLKEQEYIISKQLLRSATSIGANIEEADELIKILTAIVKTSQGRKFD